MDFQLQDLGAVLRSWGRGVVFRSPKFVPGSPVVLAHLGDTEGDLVINTNPATAGLTLPELTGQAVHAMDYEGENPQIEIPLYVTDPTMHALISPSGSAHAGRERRGVVAEHTIAIFSEELWLDPATGRVDRTKDLSYEAGVWTWNSLAITTEKQALLDSTFWAWRCAFTRPPRRFRGGSGDNRKNLETVTLQLMHHPDMPDGHHLYSTGDLDMTGIDIEGGS